MSHHRYFYIAIEIFSFVIGTYFFRQIQNRFLFLYIFVAFGIFTEAIQALLVSLGSSNTLWVTHIYFPLEFLLLSLFYLKNTRSIFIRKWMIIAVSGLILFSIINPIIWQKLTVYSHVRSFTSICLVVFSLLYFYRVISEAKIRKLSNEPMIWINTGVLIYFSASLFHVVLFTIILEYSRKFLKLSSDYFAILTVLFYLLIAVAFVIESWPKNRKKDRAN